MSENVSSARESYIFGNYEILETTGSGGMGVVYRAVDLALNRTVALKVLRDDLRNQPHLVARFQREAKAFAALDHPNIVHIYSVGVIGRIPYIAMEFVEGEPLSEVLMSRGPIPWREALEIGSQVADALACAHDHLIIHRDIKPGNILIDREGRARVTDFGIAKVLNASTQLTADGARLGTPQYMCPERCQNKEITPLSDIYSLGVVLFQCISGRLPYETNSSVELIQRIASEPPARLRQFVPDAPDAVERLLAYMIEKKPAARPKDARELRTLIDRVLDGKPLDDHLDGMVHAIASFRKSLPPTATARAERDATTQLPAKQGWLERVSAAWFRRSRGTRLGLAGLAVLLLAALAGAAGYQALSRHTAWGNRPNLRLLATDAGRWHALNALATFSEETPQVQVIRFNLADFAVRSIVPSGGSQDAAVALIGLPGTARAGQHALCVVNPGVRDAAVLLSPTPVEFRVLGSASASSGEPGCLLASACDTVFAGLTPTERPPRGLLAQPADAATILPGKNVLALAARWTDAYGIAESDPETGQTRPLIGIANGRVQRMAYSADGAKLAYLMDDGVWLLDKSAGTSKCLLPGRAGLGPMPFSPDGKILAAIAQGSNGTSIKLLDAADGHEVADAGTGAAVLWHPSGAYLLIAAADRAERLQLWAVKKAAPYERVQLTHLGAGVTEEVAVSDDGKYALSAEPEVAALVAVALPESL